MLKLPCLSMPTSRLTSVRPAKVLTGACWPTPDFSGSFDTSSIFFPMHQHEFPHHRLHQIHHVQIQSHLRLPSSAVLKDVSPVSCKTTRLQTTCTCTTSQIQAKFVAVKLWEIGRCSLFFPCRSAWMRKLVAVRVVVLHTSGAMAMNCGGAVSVEARKEGAVKEIPPPPFMLRAARRRRAFILVAVGDSQG